jgi:hypothetical protein
MQTTHVLEVRQGVWIDEQWLKEVGLGNRVQVIMSSGEIRIQDASQSEELTQPSEKGWAIFRTLGDDAPIGTLKNASEDHDQYLYRKA